ncbi:MAG: ChaN family lipoprotein [Fimbriimonadaceae bacterium]
MLIAALAIAQDGPDPYLLDIVGPGRITVEDGIYRTTDGAKVTVREVVDAAKDVRFVFVGESHDQLQHHLAQATIIQLLAASGRDVVVGFEMFTRDNQHNLAPWTRGRWTREEFIENAAWKTQWGFDFALYEPIFNAVKAHKLPMVALNLPRDWVRQVGRNGLSVLTEEQREWVPDPYLGNEKHKALFTAMMGGHPMTGTQGENIYSAQVCWDEGMATSALDYMGQRHSKNAVMVVVAGSGHTMYGQGINYRVWRKTGERTLNVVCINSDGPRQVSKGIADFVAVSR